MARKQRSPVAWFGGKSQLSGTMSDLMPEHHIYAEVFGGGGSLLFAKEPSPVEVYNDLDGGLVNFFAVLRDPQRMQRLYYLVSNTPYAREEWQRCLETWRQCDDPAERAHRWWVVNRMSFSKMFGNGWGRSVASTSRGMSRQVADWQSAHERLAEAHKRLMRVQVEKIDAIKCIDAYDTPHTLFYCDPPYVPDTRRSGQYDHELTIEQHEQLVGKLLTIQGEAMLSGYDHEIYQPLIDAGWEKTSFEVMCHCVGHTRAMRDKGIDRHRTEVLWMSPGVAAVASRKRIDSRRRSGGQIRCQR